MEHLALLDTAIHPRFLPADLRLHLHLRQIALLRQGVQGRRPLAALCNLSRELDFVLQGFLLRLGQRQEVAMGDMLDLPPVLERVREASGEAFVSYRPPQYDGAVLFLRATEHSEREAAPLADMAAGRGTG